MSSSSTRTRTSTIIYKGICYIFFESWKIELFDIYIHALEVLTLVDGDVDFDDSIAREEVIEILFLPECRAMEKQE